MIDTPGHVDFSYEVSRSLAACEGALLVVDAAQGVEAQSVANCYTALEQGLEVVPVLNKIDLPSAEPDRVIKEIEEIIGIEASDALRVSAKTGEGVPELLEELVRARARRRRAIRMRPLQALIIDSWFDNYVGVVSLVRVMNGSLRVGDEDPHVVHGPRAHRRQARALHAEVAGRREALDTGRSRLRHRRHQGDQRRAGGRHHHPGRAPGERRRWPASSRSSRACSPACSRCNTEDYESFRDALAKLKLNDSALHYEPEVSTALGFGFRCGFLGLLHMDIVQERLEREYNLDLITSAPTVVYEILQHRRHDDLRRQSVEAAAQQRDRGTARTHHHGQHPAAARIRRRR